MLLPMTLPMRISVLLLMSDEKETASSGAPVPKATIVRPINSLLTLKLEAIDEAPLTSQSAPLISKMKPMIRIRVCKTIVIMVMIISYFCQHKNGASEETLTLDLFLGKEAL